MLYVNFLSFTLNFPFNSKDNVLADFFFLTNNVGVWPAILHKNYFLYQTGNNKHI